MKKRSLGYIPLLLLAVFVLSTLIVHYSNIFDILDPPSRTVQLPFKYQTSVTSVKPEAERAGIRVGDRVTAINGKTLDNENTYDQAENGLQLDQPVSLSVERTAAGGQIEKFETSVLPVKIERNFGFYSTIAINFLLLYFLPTFSILLGLWVVFVRPRDFLAWLLLFVLFGLASLVLERYPDDTLVGTFQNVFFFSWALAMLLFGIYFPERWSLDAKFPWAKWILIAPLALQVIFTVLGQVDVFFGTRILNSVSFLAKPFSAIFAPINLIAIGMFFVALGHKSGTLQNPDARRRLRLMVIGAFVALTPSFFIIIYKIFTGAKGGFSDIVPLWFAVLAVLAMPLFPITMAYVIVVQRAMDVSVVVRQGLQYALAKNGIRILQLALLLAVLLGTLLIIRNFGENISTQIAFIVGGLALIPLIDTIAKRLRVWIDRKFFREAYNAEQILSDLSEEVRTMVETKPLLETVSAKISESLHVPQVALLLKNGGDFQPAYTLGYESAPDVRLMENDVAIEKLRKNETLVVYQDDEESWVNEEAEGAERENLRELNSQLLLPVGAKNGLSGVISLSPKLSEEPYSANDLRLLKSVAAQTGLALENSRLTEAIVSEAAQRERLNTEIDIAREVQERLFPQDLPAVEGLDYYGACRPALGVGGDYYDFLELPSGKFGIAIGDISGKGIGASLMMASLQASLRGQAIHFGDDLAGLMTQINSLVYEASTTNRYATFFYAQYEPATRKLAYVNAGHNPPCVIRRKNGGFEVLKLEEGGAVVGMLPSMLVNYKQGEIDLQSGDLLVGFTDGISEAMNPHEEEWGEEAMLAELEKVYERPSAEILPHIVAAADRFANGAKQHDDMTMIIVKVR